MNSGGRILWNPLELSRILWYPLISARIIWNLPSAGPVLATAVAVMTDRAHETSHTSNTAAGAGSNLTYLTLYVA